MAPNTTKSRKRRHTADLSDDPSSPGKMERETKIFKSFHERDEILRNLITCKICFRPLYEPFTNECGHTYCYTCLCQWFKSGPTRRKTCPDCRKNLSQTPTPAYALRELTREMTHRTDLLPPGETVEDHQAAQTEEFLTVEKDRAKDPDPSSGLFGGCFKPLAQRALRRMFDAEDGVHRCPECAWELEGEIDECEHCGAPILFFDDEGTSTQNSEDEDLDGDLTDNDADFNHSMTPHVGDYDEYFDHQFSSDGYVSSNGMYRPMVWISDDDDEEGEETDEEEGGSDEQSSLDGFVVDDDENHTGNGNDIHDGARESEDDDQESGSSDASSSSTPSAARQESNRMPSRAKYTVIDSDDDESDSTKESTATAPASATTNYQVLPGGHSSRDPHANSRSNHISRRRGGRRTIDSDESE